MSLKKRLLEGPSPLPRPQHARPKHPSGWEPRVEETGDTASVITQPIAGNPDHAELLRASDLDPEEWHIIGDIQVRRWQQTEDGPWLRYFKFNARSGKPQGDPEFEAACAKLLTHKPKAPKPKPAVEKALVFCLADWQAGKREKNGGSGQTAERIVDLVNKATALAKSEKPDAIYIIGLGDIIESCTGSYPSQEFMVDLNHSEQERFARRGILAITKALARHSPRVVLGAIKGNHGSTRKNGKPFTEPNDNRDILVFETVAEALAEAPAYKHISFAHPGDDIAMTLDIAGVPITFVHGDEFGKGSTPLEKAVEWFKGQSAGGFHPGDARAVVWGHYHHYIAANRLGKWFFQCPTIDPGSDWFTRRTGEHSDPGTLVLKIRDGQICPIFIPAE